MLTANDIKRLRSLKEKSVRDKEGLFVAEGERAIREIYAAGIEPIEYYSVSDGDITPSQLERISSLKTPQGSFAVFHKPESMYKSIPENKLSIVLDGIQDPGNLGTIIRTADWFGIDSIYASPMTADCFNPKVVQSTMGAIARVHVTYLDIQSLLSNAKIPIYGTFMDNAENIYHTKLPSSALLVLGNEGNGISPQVEALVTNRITIPHGSGPHVESLNVSVAAAIAISEFIKNSGH